MFYVPSGADRLSALFNGPDPDIRDVQAAAIFFFPSYVSARRAYTQAHGFLVRQFEQSDDPEGTAAYADNIIQPDRNVVTDWVRPDSPARFRAIISGRLRTRPLTRDRFSLSPLYAVVAPREAVPG